MDTRVPRPVLYSYRCTGCSDCVAVCPVEALVVRNNVAILAQPDACTYCGLCEELCPSQAIALPYVVLFEESRRRAEQSVRVPALAGAF